MRSFTLRSTVITLLLAATGLGSGAPADAVASRIPANDTAVTGTVFAPIADTTSDTHTPDRASAAARPGRGAPAARPSLVRGEPLASRNPRVTYSTRGVAASAYVGPRYDARHERIRRCIVERESSGVYTVRGGDGGNYFGAYQMSDALADGAAWMMVATLKHEVGKPAAKAITARLRTQPFNTWSRYWQDRAFWTIWNHGKGAKHWAGGRWHC